MLIRTEYWFKLNIDSNAKLFYNAKFDWIVIFFVLILDLVGRYFAELIRLRSSSSSSSTDEAKLNLSGPHSSSSSRQKEEKT